MALFINVYVSVCEEYAHAKAFEKLLFERELYANDSIICVKWTIREDMHPVLLEC